MNTNILTLASGLSDHELLARLGALAAREREALVELVAHLAALDARPSLYAGKGYGSLFSYCVQVLRLRETFALAEVEQAIDDALRMGTISFDAVKHLLLCRIEQRPARLDLENYPHLPVAQVATTAAADYLTLLNCGAY